MKALAAVVLIMLFAIPALGQDAVYRWVDDQGTVHFTAQPPEDHEYERVDTESGSVAAAGEDAAAEESFRPMEIEVGEAAEPAEPDAEEITRLCADAREQLQILEQRARVMMRDEDGEETALEDDERQELIAETRQFMTENC